MCSGFSTLFVRVVVALLILVPASAHAQLSTWEMESNPPAVLFVTPEGNGNSLGEIGSTLTVTYVDDLGDPLAFVPRDRMFALLEGTQGHLCAPFLADSATNANGVTAYSGGFAGGGWSQSGIYMYASPGSLTIVYTLGVVPIHFNSPDIDGNGRVDLRDLGLFSQDFTGAYHFRSDFFFDGVLDLADFGRLATHYGERCP